MFYWVKLRSGKTGTLQAAGEPQAIEKADAMGGAETIDRLPYPAKPFLEEIGHPDFCWTPTECKGHTCCPKEYACSN